jgi:protein-disulfide isomerase
MARLVRSVPARLLLPLASLAAVLAAAADPEEAPAPPASPVYREGLTGVDLTGLTEEQRDLALRVLNESPCDCGCGMTVAQCRVEDQSCPRSPGLARAIVDAVRRGGGEQAARDAYGRAAAGGGAARAPDPHAVRHDIPVGDSPARGAPDAPITIVEFADFQCPFCARAEPVVAQVLGTYPEQVRVVFKHLPQSIHPQARGAALAAEAAREQGKFWEMHERLFRNPNALEREHLLAHARDLGLDMGRFTADLDSERIAARVDRDVAEAERVGAGLTPAFYLNGSRLRNWQWSTFHAAIERALAAPAPPAG